MIKIHSEHLQRLNRLYPMLFPVKRSILSLKTNTIKFTNKNNVNQHDEEASKQINI
jgi:hypothetical protein